ncbi:hypothetical protein [Sedimentimonas flavescens]|uniref:hypothetical protein n=1 Tax=Sedimentimonas flavescens TaxID=2851012 RepID=UPI0021A82C7F|nr:hypothetical protein [Sedimentimonas flavescens]MCT2541108.1 hypothetical protein [Sedimentimonas flavescens]
MTLVPSVSQDVLYPADAAWMARTDLKTTRLLGYTDVNIDSVTGVTIGILGRQPSVRHASMVTDEILEFLGNARLSVEEDMRVYRSENEAIAAARSLIAEGYRLFSPYPLPAGLYPDDASVVPAPLWYRLNAKARMSELFPAEHLAPRQIVNDNSNIAPPVYLKAGGAAVTGWAYAVRYCETQEEIEGALKWFHEAGAAADLVAEDALNVITCWCAHVGCSDTETVYLGAAEQTFSAPARQTGSIIDAARDFPEAGRRIVRAAGEKARQLGYRGIAAFDVGLTDDGRLIAFDPNFRVNASTTQVLLHEAATRGTAWSTSQSVGGPTLLPISEIMARLDGPSREGWFVPTRLLDATLLDAAKGNSLWTGFVLGKDRQETADRGAALAGMLAEWD